MIQNKKKIVKKDKKIKNDASCIRVYFPKSGDTLWKIAKRYKTTVSNIMELNNLENDNIKVGDKLYIQRYKNNKIGISA